MGVVFRFLGAFFRFAPIAVVCAFDVGVGVFYGCVVLGGVDCDG